MTLIFLDRTESERSLRSLSAEEAALVTFPDGGWAYLWVADRPCD